MNKTQGKSSTTLDIPLDFCMQIPLPFIVLASCFQAFLDIAQSQGFSKFYSTAKEAIAKETLNWKKLEEQTQKNKVARTNTGPIASVLVHLDDDTLGMLGCARGCAWVCVTVCVEARTNTGPIASVLVHLDDDTLGVCMCMFMLACGLVCTCVCGSLNQHGADRVSAGASG